MTSDADNDRTGNDRMEWEIRKLWPRLSGDVQLWAAPAVHETPDLTNTRLTRWREWLRNEAWALEYLEKDDLEDYLED